MTSIVDPKQDVAGAGLQHDRAWSARGEIRHG
jgi:hypothetical protein